jgi:hypothetical protein
VDKLYKLYFHRQDAEGTPHQDDGVGITDAAVTTEPENSLFAGAIIVNNVQAETYQTSFVVYEPGPYWSVSMWNDVGQTTSTTGADHYIRYIYTDA